MFRQGWDRFIPFFGLPAEPDVKLKKVEDRSCAQIEKDLATATK